MTSETIAMHTILLERRGAREKWFTRLHAKSISSADRIRDWLARTRGQDTLWISYEQSLTNALLRASD